MHSHLMYKARQARTQGLFEADVRNGENIIRGQVCYLPNNTAVETWIWIWCDNRDTACVTVSVDTLVDPPISTKLIPRAPFS